MKRVNVKGISGSGKSTFALELARRLGLPFVELDALHHGPNWSEPTDEVFRARVKPELLGPVVSSFEDGSVVHTGEGVPPAVGVPLLTCTFIVPWVMTSATLPGAYAPPGVVTPAVPASGNVPFVRVFAAARPSGVAAKSVPLFASSCFTLE